MQEKKFEPIPIDLTSEAGPGRGPCWVHNDAVHLVVNTNMLGPIQCHPCKCGGVFTYSDTYGWMEIKSRELNDRIREAVKEARKANKLGWVGSRYI